MESKNKKNSAVKKVDEIVKSAKVIPRGRNADYGNRNDKNGSEKSPRQKEADRK